MSHTLDSIQNAASGRIGKVAFLAFVAGWLCLIVVNAIYTVHAFPDYGDLIRWVHRFIIPLAESAEPQILDSLFSEYEFPGHGHVLTKSLILAISQHSAFNFHILKVVGIASYCLLIALLLYGAIYDMRRYGRSTNWLALMLLVVLYAHPDEKNSVSSNLLSFEYTFLLLAWLFVIASYRAIVENIGIILVGFSALIAALFADIPFWLSLLTVNGMLLNAIYSGERRLQELIPLVVICVAIPLVIYALGAGGNSQSADLNSFDLLRFMKWMCAGMGSGLLSAQYLMTIGVSQEFAHGFLTSLGLLVLGGVLITLVDILVHRTRTNLGSAMILFGTLAIAGTFVTRISFGDDYILAPRYVRYSTFVSVGLAWYWIIARADFLAELKPRPMFSALGLTAWTICLLVFFAQTIKFAGGMRGTAAYYQRQEQAMLDFVAGDKAKFAEIQSRLPSYLKQKPDVAKRTLAFYFECRESVDRCRIE